METHALGQGIVERCHLCEEVLDRNLRQYECHQPVNGGGPHLQMDEIFNCGRPDTDQSRDRCAPWMDAALPEPSEDSV